MCNPATQRSAEVDWKSPVPARWKERWFVPQKIPAWRRLRVPNSRPLRVQVGNRRRRRRRCRCSWRSWTSSRRTCAAPGAVPSTPTSWRGSTGCASRGRRTPTRSSPTRWDSARRSRRSPSSPTSSTRSVPRQRGQSRRSTSSERRAPICPVVRGCYFPERPVEKCLNNIVILKKNRRALPRQCSPSPQCTTSSCFRVTPRDPSSSAPPFPPSPTGSASSSSGLRSSTSWRTQAEKWTAPPSGGWGNGGGGCNGTPSPPPPLNQGVTVKLRLSQSAPAPKRLV